MSGLHQADDVPQRDALAGAAPAEDARTPQPAGTSNVTSSQHAAVAEGLGHVLQPHRRHRPACAAIAGRRASTSVAASSAPRLWKHEEDEPHQDDVRHDDSIDDSTTARVDARPTPSVPDSVVNPRYDEIVAMMNPKTIVFIVAGT